MASRRLIASWSAGPPARAAWEAATDGWRGPGRRQEPGRRRGAGGTRMREEAGTGCVPFSPLGRGLLAGKLDPNTSFDTTDLRSNLQRFAPEALKANQAMVDLLR